MGTTKIDYSKKTYFKHYNEMRQDPRIIRAELKHKEFVYAVYYKTLEVLRGTINYEYAIEDIPILADIIRIDAEIVESIIKDFKLFTINKDFFYSEELSSSQQSYEEKVMNSTINGIKGNLIRHHKYDKKILDKMSDSEVLQLNSTLKGCSPQNIAPDIAPELPPDVAPESLPVANRIELNRIELNRTKENRIKKNKIEFNKIKLNKTKKNKTKLNSSKQKDNTMQASNININRESNNQEELDNLSLKDTEVQKVYFGGEVEPLWQEYLDFRSEYGLPVSEYECECLVSDLKNISTESKVQMEILQRCLTLETKNFKIPNKEKPSSYDFKGITENIIEEMEEKGVGEPEEGQEESLGGEVVAKEVGKEDKPKKRIKRKLRDMGYVPPIKTAFGKYIKMREEIEEKEFDKNDKLEIWNKLKTYSDNENILIMILRESCEYKRVEFKRIDISKLSVRERRSLDEFPEDEIDVKSLVRTYED